MKDWLSNLFGIVALIALFVIIIFGTWTGLNAATVGVYEESPALAWELYQESRDLEFKRHNEALGAK